MTWRATADRPYDTETYATSRAREIMEELVGAERERGQQRGVAGQGADLAHGRGGGGGGMGDGGGGGGWGDSGGGGGGWGGAPSSAQLAAERLRRGGGTAGVGAGWDDMGAGHGRAYGGGGGSAAAATAAAVAATQGRMHSGAALSTAATAAAAAAAETAAAAAQGRLLHNQGAVLQARSRHLEGVSFEAGERDRSMRVAGRAARQDLEAGAYTRSLLSST